MTSRPFLLPLRWQIAKALVAFYEGRGPYPMGLPPVVSQYDGKNCWDTAPESYRFSEYGSGAGSV
jgi:hypothetical protein